MRYIYFVSFRTESSGVSWFQNREIILPAAITRIEHIYAIQDEIESDLSEPGEAIVLNYQLLRTEDE